MIRKDELVFIRKVVQRGWATGEAILECIEQVRSDYASTKMGLPDMLVHKGILSRKQIKEIQQALGENESQESPEGGTDTRKIGNYELLEKKGEGAMGAVYKARNMENNKIVALKLLDQKLAEDQSFITRFLREARNAAKLKNHENIVEAYDFGENDGHYYFAMEFVSGKTLAEILYGKGKIGERTSLNIARQVAQALSHANRFSIIHRDVKPENIIISSDGVVKLCDLGLAKDRSKDFSLAREGITLGTAYYVSPEQASGRKDLDIRTDIYSLGISLFHMLTGELPFDDPDSMKVVQKHISEKIPNVQERAPEISAETAKLVQKMTEKTPEERYQAPESLVHDIENILQGRLPTFGMKEKEKRTEKSTTSMLTRKKKAPFFPKKYVYAALAGAVFVALTMALLFSLR